MAPCAVVRARQYGQVNITSPFFVIDGVISTLTNLTALKNRLSLLLSLCRGLSLFHPFCLPTGALVRAHGRAHTHAQAGSIGL
jgi:hypothetical protein